MGSRKPPTPEMADDLDSDGGFEVSQSSEGKEKNDERDMSAWEQRTDGQAHQNHDSVVDGRSTINFRGSARQETAGDSPDAASISSWGSDNQEEANWRAWERCISASTKGFVIGAGIRGSLGLVAVLSRLRRKKPSLSGKSDAEAIRVALKETWRYGLFLGTFAGSFCTVDEMIAAIGGWKRTARWRSFVAGAIAGPSLLLTGSQLRHTSMAIYILMRGLVLAARCGVKSRRVGPICRPLTWKHGDTFLMCLSSSQILYAWIMHPTSLPSTYVAFLNKHGGKDTSIVRGICALAAKNEVDEHLLAVRQHYNSMGVNVNIPPDIEIPCAMVHGDQGCVEHFFSFIGHSYLRSIPVYLPVYLVPALLVHRQGLFARPLTILSKNLLGTARSSLFLATYCASAWLWTCWGFRASGTCNHPLVLASTFPTGLAVLIEKKSRRMELALYCLARAVESFSICVADSHLMKHRSLTVPDRVDVLIFSLATSIIMHCYSEEREVFRSKYLNVLDWVFGIPDPKRSSRPTPGDKSWQQFAPAMKTVFPKKSK